MQKQNDTTQDGKENNERNTKMALHAIVDKRSSQLNYLIVWDK
jgi:hypothetical protein